MNISPDGKTVSFKTINDDALFNVEKSGAKPNTVRIIDQSDREKLRKQLPEKILIQGHDEIFLRTLTNIHVSEIILGKYLAVFSWTNTGHQHVISVPCNDDPLAHSMHIDLVEPEIKTLESGITLPRTLIADLDWYRGKDTYSAFISKMLIAYTTPPHCHPPAWTFRDEDKTREVDDER